MKALRFACIGLLVATAFSVASAQPAPGGNMQGGGKPPEGEPGEHRGPPPESIAACKTLKMDDACSFTSPRGKESGSCWRPETSKPLACRPARK